MLGNSRNDSKIAFHIKNIMYLGRIRRRLLPLQATIFSLKESTFKLNIFCCWSIFFRNIHVPYVQCVCMLGDKYGAQSWSESVNVCHPIKWMHNSITPPQYNSPYIKCIHINIYFSTTNCNFIFILLSLFYYTYIYKRSICIQLFLAIWACICTRICDYIIYL